MTVDAAERAYKARALAQAHPLTALAKRFQDRGIAEQEAEQPMVELARWAGDALLKGYCLRKVEEQVDRGGAVVEAAADIDLATIEARTAEIAADLRTGDPAPHLLCDATLTFGALDQIIRSELGNRIDSYRSQVDAVSWRQFEEYIAWWAVRGYAFRAAEATVDAPA